MNIKYYLLVLNHPGTLSGNNPCIVYAVLKKYSAIDRIYLL